MSVLELARKVYNRQKAQRNGHHPAAVLAPLVAKATQRPIPESKPCCEKSEKSEKSPPAYLLVADTAGLQTVAQALDESGDLIGLDTETTGLSPLKDRARLVQLATDRGVYLIDMFSVNPAPLWEPLAEKTLVIHNAVFDIGFLAALGFRPGAVRCTMLLSRMLHGTRKGKGFHGLEKAVERELGRTISKTEQKSDWSAPILSREQLDYAASDAEVLLPLHDALLKQLTGAGQARAVEVESRCLPAMAWVSCAGVPFDKDAWLALAGQSEAKAENIAQRLDALAPQRPGYLPETKWNWRSQRQTKEVFALLGIELEKTDDDTLATVGHPLAQALRDYRAADKEVTSYGSEWMKFIAADGRLHAEWRQLGCITGRMSCKNPAMQTIPKQDARRKCFHAPDGRVLVRADYSQIELRIAAKIANEKKMIAAYHAGEDLHFLTARKLTGKAEVSKQERNLAKPVNFGLIYGLSPKGLRRSARRDYGINLSEQEAYRYCRAFFEAWPGIQEWHNRIRREQPSTVKTLTGRRVPLGPKSFFGTAANYAVQGSGGDGIKQALALLYERRSECPGAFPILVIHDEIVIECDRDQAEAVSAWLKRAMLDGMAPLIDPVPVEVEVHIAQTWGGD